MGLQITVEEACVVKPSQPTLQHRMFLCATDMLMKYSKPSRTILFYPDDRVNPASAFASLRQGLATTLVAYYPFAGRLALDEDSGRLVLDCNDAGVELILARCDSVSYSDLASDNFLPRPFFRQLVPMDDLPRSDHVGVPLTAVQLTVFPGGLTVGIANQHSVADGFAFWTFIQTLAQACRGERFTLQPLHYRALLRPDTVMHNKFPLKPAPPKPDIAPCPDDSFSYSFDASDPQNPLLQVVVHFRKEMLDTLKKACSSADINSSSGLASPDNSFSTYQVLSAYLWKRYIMARGFDDRAPVQFLHLLDIRHRIVPPLTSAFCGNAIAGFFTVGTVKDIKEESLGGTAARIRQTIREVDDYSIKRFITEVENPDLSHVPINLFRLRNASRFPVYEAGDLGWGKPAAVRPPISDTEGEATWYPSKKPGSIDVVFALLKTTCARFFSPDLYAHDPLDISLLTPSVLPAG